MMSDYFEKNLREIIKYGHCPDANSGERLNKEATDENSALLIDLEGLSFIKLNDVDFTKYTNYRAHIYLSNLLYLFFTYKQQILNEFDGKETLITLIISIIDKFKKNILEYINSSSCVDPTLLTMLNELYKSL